MKAHENETDHERFTRGRKKRVESLSEEALSQISDQAIKCIDPKTQEVKLRCKLCRKREFRMISSFEKHVQDHKAGRIKIEKEASSSFDCELCDKSFSSGKQLARHKLVHSAKVNTNHVCSKCNQSFRWKSFLHAHAKRCTANKGAEKRKARLKAKEKMMRQLRGTSDDEDIKETDELIESIPTTTEDCDVDLNEGELEDTDLPKEMNDIDSEVPVTLNNDEETLVAVQDDQVELRFDEQTQTEDSKGEEEDEDDDDDEAIEKEEEQVTVMLVQLDQEGTIEEGHVVTDHGQTNDYDPLNDVETTSVLLATTEALAIVAEASSIRREEQLIQNAPTSAVHCNTTNETNVESNTELETD